MLKDRFLSKVIKTDNCWWWTANTDQGGYGQMSYTVDKKRYCLKAHRASWLIFKGPIPVGKMVTHLCDNRFCVNPDHLKIGDQESNMRDMIKRGHSRYGELNVKAKLTPNAITEIRKMSRDGVKTIKLAEMFKIGKGQICNIVSGRHWKHIPFPQEKDSESLYNPSA